MSSTVPCCVRKSVPPLKCIVSLFKRVHASGTISLGYSDIIVVISADIILVIIISISTSISKYVFLHVYLCVTYAGGCSGCKYGVNRDDQKCKYGKPCVCVCV